MLAKTSKVSETLLRIWCSDQQFGYLLRKTAATEITIISLGCFISAAEYDVTNLFLPAQPQALTDNGGLRANEGVFVVL